MSLPPVCPYCGVQTDEPSDHMRDRHGISPLDHQLNLDRAGRTLPDYGIPKPGTHLPTGGYL